MGEIYKFDVKVNVIPNGLEKYMSFKINYNLVFFGNMQFMKYSLDAMVKNLSDNDLKYLLQEFICDFLKLVKQKGVYPFQYIDNFKKFSEDKLPDRYKFFSYLKEECISEKDYLHTIKFWNAFKININWVITMKTDILVLADVFKKLINTC